MGRRDTELLDVQKVEDARKVCKGKMHVYVSEMLGRPASLKIWEIK